MPWLEYTCSACGDQVFAMEIPENHICHICINKKIQFTCSECGKVINVKVAPPSGLCGACQGKHLRSALKKGKKNTLQAKKRKRKIPEDTVSTTPIHYVDSSGNDINISEFLLDCKHENVMKDSSGETFCKTCGLVLEDHIVFLNTADDPRAILEKFTQKILSTKFNAKARHKGRASQSEIDKREIRDQKRKDRELDEELLRIHRAEKSIIRDQKRLDEREHEHDWKVFRCNREHPGEVFCDVCVIWIPSEIAIEHRRSHLPSHQVWGATKHAKKHQEHPFPHAGKCYCPHCQQWIPACIKHKHNRMHFPKARKPFKHMGTGRPHRKKPPHPRESKEKEQLQKDLIDLLTKEGHQTRNQLVAKLGKPRTTLFDDLEELMQNGMVESFDLPNEKKRGRPFKVYAIAGSEEKPCRKQDQIKTYKPHPNEHPHCFFCKICEQWIPAATGKKAHSRVHCSNGRNYTPDITSEVLELLKSGPIMLKDFKNEIKLKPSTIYRKLMDMVAQEQIIMYRAKNPSGKHNTLYQFFALPSVGA